MEISTEVAGNMAWRLPFGHFPEDRTGGVFSFVFKQRLYVWPKAKMDRAIIQMLHTAGLMDEAAKDAYAEGGLSPLKAIVVKERGE